MFELFTVFSNAQPQLTLRKVSVLQNMLALHMFDLLDVHVFN